MGEGIAHLDVTLSLAQVAVQNNYIKPVINDSTELFILKGRHPVVEKQLGRDKFIANDTTFQKDQKRIAIITGPNMAGKSTFLRQSALIVILAQMGSFVPAERAEIGIVDKIFTRIGASDRLSQGQSTFMVEMEEVANLLRYCTAQSLLVLDEVGRGTSTYDGVSIAWAVLEYLSTLKPRTLFATHYFELTQLEDQLSCVYNLQATAKEWPGSDGRRQVVFLYQIRSGAADRSYGIHVADMAGLPPVCVQRAREILHKLENGTHQFSSPDKKADKEAQLDFFGEHPVLEDIRQIDPNTITPLEALSVLSSLKNQLMEKKIDG
jgi:DNA mismatch repair protein MutS